MLLPANLGNYLTRTSAGRFEKICLVIRVIRPMPLMKKFEWNVWKILLHPERNLSFSEPDGDLDNFRSVANPHRRAPSAESGRDIEMGIRLFQVTHTHFINGRSNVI